MNPQTEKTAMEKELNCSDCGMPFSVNEDHALCSKCHYRWEKGNKEIEDLKSKLDLAVDGLEIIERETPTAIDSEPLIHMLNRIAKQTLAQIAGEKEGK